MKIEVHVPQASLFRTQARSPIASTEKKDIALNYEVGFYSYDAGLLDDLTRFIEAALKAGIAAIFVVPNHTVIAFC